MHLVTDLELSFKLVACFCLVYSWPPPLPSGNRLNEEWDNLCPELKPVPNELRYHGVQSSKRCNMKQKSTEYFIQIRVVLKDRLYPPPKYMRGTKKIKHMGCNCNCSTYLVNFSRKFPSWTMNFTITIYILLNPCLCSNLSIGYPLCSLNQKWGHIRIWEKLSS